MTGRLVWALIAICLVTGIALSWNGPSPLGNYLLGMSSGLCVSDAILSRRRKTAPARPTGSH